MPGTASTLAAHDSLLLIVDMQERLLPAIRDADALCGRVARLAQAARVLSVPVWATEHWPGKIGATHPDLLAHVDHVVAKTHFDACREADFLADWPAGRTRVLLTGTEAHICVLQTGLGLARAGFQPVPRMPPPVMTAPATPPRPAPVTADF